MRVETYKCDICGREKGENNHWFRVCTRGPGLELHAWGSVPSSETTVDLCSDQCVVKTVQHWLNAQVHVPSPRGEEVRVSGEVLFP